MEASQSQATRQGRQTGHPWWVAWGSASPTQATRQGRQTGHSPGVACPGRPYSTRLLSRRHEPPVYSRATPGGSPARGGIGRLPGAASVAWGHPWRVAWGGLK